MLESLRPTQDATRAITRLHDAGCTVLIVGGAVRDALLGKQHKDVDFEVYGATPEQLVSLLAHKGLGTRRVGLEGNSFGVVRWISEEGGQYEFAVPRVEKKRGSGHTGFVMSYDPNMPYEDAFARRDFTINAMGFDPRTGDLYDPHGGREDLQGGVLRHTSEKFSEDPLRVLRGMRFVCAMGLSLHPTTAEECRRLATEEPQIGVSCFDELSKERVSEELCKTLMGAKYPERLLPYLVETGWIKFFPLLEGMVGQPQDPKWHPEIFVDVHIGQVMSVMSQICDERGIEDQRRLVLMLASLLHDVGKKDTFRADVLPDGTEKISTHGHAELGAELLRAWMNEMRFAGAITNEVCALTRHHMFHVDAKARRHLRRLACEVDLGLLEMLIEADKSGRVAGGGAPPRPSGTGSATMLFDAARADGLINGHRGVAPKKVILGRHISELYGMSPGPGLGKVVEAAWKAQLAGSFSNHPFESNNGAREWLEAYCARNLSLLKWLDVEPVGRTVSGCKTILAEAWSAQKSGKFSDRAGAMKWLLARGGANANLAV